MDKNKPKKENRVILIGIGLILIVISITILKPVLKGNDEKDTGSKEPEAIYSDYEYLTSSELKKKIDNNDNITIVDIRDSVSYRDEHIEGSINITPEKIEEEIDKLNKNSSIVIVGYDFEDKNAEAGAVKFFKDQGFNNVVALSGGIFAWKTNLNSTINVGDPESIVDRSKVDEILPEQLKLAIDNKYPVFIIDTRKNNLFSQGHIPGAINIPIENLEKNKDKIPPSKEIVVYGESELEDFQAGVKLYDLDFFANYTITGGFKAWQEKRYPIEK